MVPEEGGEPTRGVNPIPTLVGTRLPVPPRFIQPAAGEMPEEGVEPTRGVSPTGFDSPPTRGPYLMVDVTGIRPKGLVWILTPERRPLSSKSC